MNSRTFASTIQVAKTLNSFALLLLLSIRTAYQDAGTLISATEADAGGITFQSLYSVLLNSSWMYIEVIDSVLQARVFMLSSSFTLCQKACGGQWSFAVEAELSSLPMYYWAYALIIPLGTLLSGLVEPSISGFFQSGMTSRGGRPAEIGEMNQRLKLYCWGYHQIGPQKRITVLGATRRGTMGQSSCLFWRQDGRGNPQTQRSAETFVRVAFLRCWATGSMSRRFDGDPCGGTRETFTHHRLKRPRQWRSQPGTHVILRTVGHKILAMVTILP